MPSLSSARKCVRYLEQIAFVLWIFHSGPLFAIEPSDVADLESALFALENAHYQQELSSESSKSPFDTLGSKMLAAYDPWMTADVGMTARAMPSGSISDWIDALHRIYFYSTEAAIYLHARQLFDLLVVRGQATGLDRRRLVEMSISAREFDFANSVIASNPELGFTRLPALTYIDGFDPARPATMHLVDSGRRYEVRNFETLSGDFHLIFNFHPSCSFSRKAADHLSRIKGFNCFSSEYGNWIGPMHYNDDTQAIQAWNETHPEAKVSLVYFPDEWRPVSLLETPEFYLLRSGEVIAHVEGWIPDVTPEKVREMLQVFFDQSGIQGCDR